MHKLLVFKELSSLFASLKSIHEIESVLHDLLSIHEIVMLIRRFHVAQLLLEGETYSSIMKTMRVSKDVIRSVATSISNNGSGYELAIQRLESIHKEIEKEHLKNTELMNPYSIESHKRKYKAYYLLDTVTEDAPKYIQDRLKGAERRKSLKKG